LFHFASLCPWETEKNLNFKHFMEEKMRKFWIVLLALGLVAAFSMPAFAAVDGKFSGSLRVRGWYDYNVMGIEKDTVAGATARQFYDNRLRMEPVFKIAEGLTLTTRFDALEKKWGETLATANNSISWERAYVTFDTKGGRFQVGYQENNAFGTVFGNSAGSQAMIKYFLPLGDFTLIAAIEKGLEGQGTLVAPYTSRPNQIDADYDIYDLGFVYKFKGGDAGLMMQNAVNKNYRTAANGYSMNLYIFDPYVKMKMGSVYFEAEGLYATGKWAAYDDPKARDDIDFTQYGIYMMANVDLAPAYVGGIFAWSSGDDGEDANKKKQGMFAALGLNQAVNLSLMMMSYEYTNQIGKRTGDASIQAADQIGYASDNMQFYQIFAGIKPMKDLDVKASLSYARATEKPRDAAGAKFEDSVIGTEFDLTATYKIYNNLSYMVGFGYLWVGDYFKGTNAAAKTENDYLLMHQLLLSF